MGTAARERYVPVDGAQLYVREIGAGPPVIVLHGGPDFDHFYLLPELDEVAAACRLVYYDQRGRGRSAAAVQAQDVSIESEVADLDQLRRHLELDTVALLGHSWGGVLAMEAYQRGDTLTVGIVMLICFAVLVLCISDSHQ